MHSTFLNSKEYDEKINRTYSPFYSEHREVLLRKIPKSACLIFKIDRFCQIERYLHITNFHVSNNFTVCPESNREPYGWNRICVMCSNVWVQFFKFWRLFQKQKCPSCPKKIWYRILLYPAGTESDNQRPVHWQTFMSRMFETNTLPNSVVVVSSINKDYQAVQERSVTKLNLTF